MLHQNEIVPFFMDEKRNVGGMDATEIEEDSFEKQLILRVKKVGSSSHENDPVNFVDLWGLSAADVKAEISDRITIPSWQELQAGLSKKDGNNEFSEYSQKTNIIIGAAEITIGVLIVVGGSAAAAALAPETLGASAFIGYES